MWQGKKGTPCDCGDLCYPMCCIAQHYRDSFGTSVWGNRWERPSMCLVDSCMPDTVRRKVVQSPRRRRGA